VCISLNKVHSKASNYSHGNSSRSSIQMLPIISGLVEKQVPEFGLYNWIYKIFATVRYLMFFLLRIRCLAGRLLELDKLGEQILAWCREPQGGFVLLDGQAAG